MADLQVREIQVRHGPWDIKALIVEQVSFSSNVDLQSLAAKCLLWVVCHEDRRSKRRCATVREMKEGPSRPAVRFWPQTAASCCRQKRWWRALQLTSG